MVLTALLPTLFFTWTVLFSSGASVRVIPACDQNMFHLNVEGCRSDFNRSMEDSDHQDKCPWPQAKHFYNKLRLCVDKWVKASWCMGHTFLVDEIFLEVHQTYFALCGRIHDPPLLILIVLVAPGIVITLFMPFLCIHLTTWNN